MIYMMGTHCDTFCEKIEEIGECLLRLDRSQEARQYFSRAYQILLQDAWLPKQEPERLARLRELGVG